MLTSSQQHPPRMNHTSHQDESHIPSGRITHPLSTSHTYPLSTNHTSIQDESHIPSGRITHPIKTSHTSPQDESHIPSGRITHSIRTSRIYPLSTNHTSIQDESHIPSGRITRPLRTNYTFKTVLHQFYSSPSSTHKSLNHEPKAGSQFWTRRRAPFAVQLDVAPFQRVPSCVTVKDSRDCRVTPSTCSSI